MIPWCFQQRGEFGLLIEGRPKLIIPNSGTLAGLEAMLEAIFLQGSQPANWYCGLIDDTDWTENSVDDTMASHPGWIELTSYTYQGSAVRAGPLIVSSFMETGSYPYIEVDFDSVVNGIRFTADCKVRGIFLTDSPTLGGSGGLLFATGNGLTEVSEGDRASIQQYRWLVNGIANSKAFP